MLGMNNENLTRAGLETATSGLTCQCSTDWAIGSLKILHWQSQNFVNLCKIYNVIGAQKYHQDNFWPAIVCAYISACWPFYFYFSLSFHSDLIIFTLPVHCMWFVPTTCMSPPIIEHDQKKNTLHYICCCAVPSSAVASSTVFTSAEFLCCAHIRCLHFRLPGGRRFHVDLRGMAPRGRCLWRRPGKNCTTEVFLCCVLSDAWSAC